MKREQIAPLDLHELLDRTHLIAVTFEQFVSEHPAAAHPKLQKKISVIETRLYALYQEIANVE